jgi:hypothetical protein
MVVDGLETIEVEEGHRQGLLAPLRLRHRLLQTVRQQDAVGQGRQGIVMGDMLKLAFMLLEHGDVRE